jgi:hypothetical protein
MTIRFDESSGAWDEIAQTYMTLHHVVLRRGFSVVQPLRPRADSRDNERKRTRAKELIIHDDVQS